jgi:hypothetical protein
VAQGSSPSPIDYSLEVEADFPRDLVSTMKENAAKKARRTVIGRTLRGRATLKSLLDCLKLHLPIPLVSITLPTRGYFEILFQEEEGAKATRRLTAVKWSGMCRTPTLAKCGGEAQHLEKSGVGVLQDSRMFRAQQQGPKHLALRCSWCHWKGLEV